MKIGIDASNIRTGGGKSHLINFINYSLQNDSKISFVLVSNIDILTAFKDNERVKLCTNFLLNSFNILSFLSQLILSYKYFKKNNCNVVFVPGGIFISKFRPFFTMSQNMIPFDNETINRFDFINRIKFHLIKQLQVKTFLDSSGVVFLNEYAKQIILNNIKHNINYKIINHGIQKQSQNNYKFSSQPFKILYVSDFLPYKHNYKVAKAVSDLILEGEDISLTLIGKRDKKEFKKINRLIHSNNLLKKRIKVLGALKHQEVLNQYKGASLFLFASTCENQPIIILEALSHGLPIISSNRGPMKYMISGSNVLFDSYENEDIKQIILKNMDIEKLNIISKKNFSLSKEYDLDKSAKDTLEFIKQI